MPPFQMLIARFEGAETARRILKQPHPDIRALLDKNILTMANLAVVKKTRKGRLHLRETQEVDIRHGAAAGAVAGGLAGLVAGPVGALFGTVTGAATGAVAAGVIDMGFVNADLKAFGRKLPPDSSAIMALVEDTLVPRIGTELAKRGAKIETHSLSSVAQQLLDERAEQGRTGAAASPDYNA